MPIETIPNTDTPYYLLSFDKHGHERLDDPESPGGRLSDAIVARAAADPPSHIFFFSHGWKGDMAAARDQYNRWIKAMLDLSQDRATVPVPFRPLWVGLHWPSLPFGDEDLGGTSFDNLGAGLSPDQQVATFLDRLDLEPGAEGLVRSIVDAHRKDAAATELPSSVADAYASLAGLAGYRSDGPSGPPDADGGPFDPAAAFQAGNALDASADFGGGGFLGGLLGPLRQLSYWTMKRRARRIGEGGMHQFVAELMNRLPQTRIHLMGHSFGCIVMSSVVGGRDASHPLPRPVDSVALIQGAVSTWAFGESVHGDPRPGYFNSWVRRGAVRGPIVVSHSVHDRAVSLLYPWASAIEMAAGDFDQDEAPPLNGAIGRFGVRGLPAAEFRPMLGAHEAYGFAPGRVYNLEASKYIAKGGGLSGAHSDIDGPEVAHALWQAALV